MGRLGRQRGGMSDASGFVLMLAAVLDLRAVLGLAMVALIGWASPRAGWAAVGLLMAVVAIEKAAVGGLHG